MTKELKNHHVGGFLSLKNAHFIEYASEIQHIKEKYNLTVDLSMISYVRDKLGICVKKKMKV